MRDVSDERFGSFNLEQCISGNNRKAFLMAGDSSDLLYWWHVLDEHQMLRYTLGILPDSIGAMSGSVPSVLTNSAEKRSQYQDKMVDHIESVGDSLQLIATEHARMNSLQTQRQIREWEREIESYEDQIDDIVEENVERKARLGERINKLKRKIEQLN
jgi:hypothetical protein